MTFDHKNKSQSVFTFFSAPTSSLLYFKKSLKKYNQTQLQFCIFAKALMGYQNQLSLQLPRIQRQAYIIGP